jgi:hypothetical protein
MKNIIKAAKGFYITLSILQVAYIICSVIAVLGLVTAIIAAESIIEKVNNSSIELSFTSGILKLWVEDIVLTTGSVRQFLITVIISIAVISPFILFTIRLFKNIFGDMKEGRPFSMNISARIRLLAYMIFIYAVITPLIPLISSYFFFNVFNIPQILTASPFIKKVENGFSYYVDFLAVFIGFAVLLLSWVFEYGARLQIESDETL